MIPHVDYVVREVHRHSGRTYWVVQFRRPVTKPIGYRWSASPIRHVTDYWRRLSGPDGAKVQFYVMGKPGEWLIIDAVDPAFTLDNDCGEFSL